MELVLSHYTASISELKKNPTMLLNEAEGSAIAILNHNKPSAYLVPAHLYEELLEQLDDYALIKMVKEREAHIGNAVEVKLDDL